MRKLVLAVVLGASLAGCATDTINYVMAEYGSAPKDGEVTTAHGEWNIWVHKSKPKIMVVVGTSRAISLGVGQGLTFGASPAALPEPLFEAAAAQWFAQQGRPECKVGRGRFIHGLYFEFDYECAPPAAAAPAVTSRTPGRRPAAR